jgi:hypothetical protein
MNDEPHHLQYNAIPGPLTNWHTAVMDFERPVFGPGPVVWVGVVLEGNQVMATIGKDLVVGCAGFGLTIPDALQIACAPSRAVVAPPASAR